MTCKLPRWLLAVFTFCLIASHAAFAADASPRNLVDVDWLRANLGRDDVLVLDASSTKLHNKAHVPGAVGVDLYRYGAPHNVTPSEMEKRIRSWGVRAERKVVVYDEGGGMMAPWLFYELYYHGFPEAQLFILDGGLAKWQASGGAVTAEKTPPPPPGDFTVASVREEVRVRLPEFIVASGDPARHALVEALDADYHFGARKFFNRAGHVPNAVMMPSPDFYNADKTFKSPDEIRRMAAYLGVRPEQRIHTHCGGGVAAIVPFFAFKFIAGHPDVKVYRESQMEWLRDDRGLPYWTYDAPYLRRDMAWIDGWNGRMQRMFGVAQLNLLDVRPEAAYRANHVPFAVNVPAEVIRQHLDAPAKLAQVLGAAGINPAHETVIVSAGGLDGDAALAFVALEKLGRKVSLMMESVDEWGLKGHTLTKEPTLVGAPKSPKDYAVPPASFPAGASDGVLVREAAATRGAFPRVFVASGRKAPDRAPAEGKVVHIPYDQLLTKEGAPKPAHEIWTILTKAGVPRYAELLTLSDDPGEAAINYFLLRLMGYPDVKVLLS